tara:strand:- start:229 stop:2538 length:2310 start_codon:yes stop_codon:yes gene_type:complete
MIKWIGQHIWDFISRFRADVYFDNLSSAKNNQVLLIDENEKLASVSSFLFMPDTDSSNGAESSAAGRQSLLIGEDNNLQSFITKISHSDGDGGKLYLQAGSPVSGGATNAVGGNMHVSGGAGTGKGIGGDVVLSTIIPGPSNGTSLNTSPCQLTWKSLNNNAETTAFLEGPLGLSLGIKSSEDMIFHIDHDDDDTGKSFFFKNNTSAVIAELDESGDLQIDGDLTVSGGDITLSGTGRIQGIDTVTDSTDAASKAYVDGAVGGGLSFDGSTANGLLTYKDADEITVESNATYDGTDFTLLSASQYKPILKLHNQNSSAESPELLFLNQRSSDASVVGADNDEAGKITFKTTNDRSGGAGGPEDITYAQIKTSAQDATDGSEDGQLELLIAQGGSLANVLKANSNLGVGTVLEFGDGNLFSVTTFKSAIVGFESATSTAPIFSIENQTNDANGPGLIFVKDRNNTGGAGSTSDGDGLGIITFRGYDSGGGVTDFAEFAGTAVETDAGNEAGKAQITVMSDGQVTQRNVITGTGHTTTDKVDIDLGYGSASTVTVPGFISIGGHTINDIDVAGEFVDSDEHLMTAAAINDRIAAVGGGGGGSSKIHVTWQDPQSYLFYLFNNNSWYSTGSSTLALLGTGSSPSDISSSNSEYGARIAIYTAIAACTVNKLTFNWYWSSSALSGTKAFEFAFSKFTPQDGSLGTITMNSITATDNNGNYTEFIPYQETFTFSGGNATLAAGDSIAMHMRTTDGSSSQRVLVYGTITLEAELS